MIVVRHIYPENHPKPMSMQRHFGGQFASYFPGKEAATPSTQHCLRLGVSFRVWGLGHAKQGVHVKVGFLRVRFLGIFRLMV